MPQQTTNNKLLVELLIEVKKLQKQISSLKVEVAYIKTKQSESNISVVDIEEDPVIQSWFWSS